MAPPVLRCSFQLANRLFDLCPLTAGPLTISLDEETPPTRTRSTYRISLDGPLERDGTLPAELQCPDHTWICLTVTNARPTRPSEPIRVTNVIPIAVDPDLNPTFEFGDVPMANRALRVTLHGGEYTSRNVKQEARFQFVCDRDAEEPSEPEFAWSFNGTHAFTWRSKHACSTVVPDHEVPVYEGRLLPLFLVFFAVSSFIAIRVVYPMRRRRSHTKFRPSPLRLLEWAQEAGFSDAESNESGVDEEIPLTLRMYGSAPSTGVVYGSTNI